MPFAVFVVAHADSVGRYCATRRADGSIGLPGGKVDAGEAPEAAAVREALEEGWRVNLLSTTPIQKREVDGRDVWWYAATKVKMVRLRPEDRKRGIRPLAVEAGVIAKSGMGNDALGLV